MTDGNWAWVQISKDTFPQIVGKPRYLEDKKTCGVDVKLEPKKTYVIWLNSPPYTSFTDTDGHKAVPYLLVFQTR
jgi:RNA polymerase sigma-70 factor (ECF subfamily)